MDGWTDGVCVCVCACVYIYPSPKTKTKYSRAAQRKACRVITGFYSHESYELLCLSLKKQLGTAQK